MFGQTKQWTTREDEVICRMRAEKRTYFEIGRVLGVSGSSVRRRCVELELVGETRRRQSWLSAEQKQAIEAAVRAGDKTAADVARYLGLREQCVGKHMTAIRAKLKIARPKREFPSRLLSREPTAPHLVGVPQISDRLAMTYDHLLTHEDRIEFAQTIAAACAVLREHYRRQPKQMGA